ncbi:carboxyl transferase domain-containing protein [Streptomyces durmitorensis]|uniref:Acetyl-coenzyme A carboxylase carboxyl transferase subunits beta/alpha n=1 Tax=Streptomyces durmitorensis TaxID=319947 RepID=A0ABY4PMP3_9ACTN|nr:carboxyl transferase domain-containing protein [Streptomyces durmitorensis]UQT54896.1 acetyl-CoA carboxylase [Streptomyces durmitorensis]
MPESTPGGPALRLTARAAIAAVADQDSFHELAHPAREFTEEGRQDGPLVWQGYAESRARAEERTGERESVVCGAATIGGTRAMVVSFEFGFLGGSLGERTGDRLEAAHRHARDHRLPVVSLIATGGSRMQEGMRALVQLQRVARQSELTGAAGLARIAVLRDPTTGGGWATLGAGADLILALPGSQVGFAGSRVRPPDTDPAAYTAQAQLAAGAIDEVVRPDELREALALRLRLLASPDGDARPRTEPAEPPAALGRTDLPATGWEAVSRARSPERPHADAYLDAYCTDRAPLRGDRCGGTDPGMLCGFGLREGRTVAYAAQCGTATTPAGYRTAARLVRLAGRLGIPVLTLVDTPGAANGAEAERAGAGAAIADLFAAVATSPVPVTSLVIGEGGSGGALALAAPDNLWATPDSYFSVIAPELATAILKRGPEETRATAEQLRLRPQDLVELGVARGIVPGQHP